MKQAHITITLEGSPEDKGKLRVDEFIRGLTAIVDALKDVEKRVTGRERSRVNYRISKLSQNSPAHITLEPIVEDDVAEPAETSYPSKTIYTFLSDLSQIKVHKTIPANLDFHSVQKYADISALRRKHIASVTIRNGRRRITIDDRFGRNVRQAIGPDEYEDGSLVGRLEAVNIHTGDKFYIYPILGPKKVLCVFPDSLRNEVKQALYERVEVEGVLRYKSWDRFPYAINVQRLEPYPPDDKLPTFSALVGIAPDATGDLTPTDFVRKIRDEEW